MSHGDHSPFRLNPLSQQPFAHAGWIHAEQTALLSVASRGRLLLLGQPGTGKSLLLRNLGRILTSRGITVRRLGGGDAFDDLASRDVLLIDEASVLTTVEFEQISQLRNPIIMCGLPSLPPRLSSCAEAFQAVTLEPLAPEEVAKFVIARLLDSGRPRTMFTPEALVAIARQSSGLMRLVIILAGAALFFAEQRGAVTVSVDDVAEAVSMRTFIPEELEQSVELDATLQSDRPVFETIAFRPSWLSPVAVRGWHWNRIGGISAFVCASLVVIGATVMAALQIDAIPSQALQGVQSHAMPPMASAAVPDLAASPQSPVSLQLQVAAASPPPQAEPTSLPAVAPGPSPEAALSEAPISRFEDTNSEVATLALSSRPPTQLGRAETSAKTLTFSGAIMNETMRQDGQLSLQLRIHGAHGPVDAVFHASKGLIGSGVLRGDIGTDGHITLTGRLMMGPNPFDCALQGTLKGEQLVGAATFVRASSGVAAHSSFTLSRL